MTNLTQQEHKFRLTASNIAAYFKHKCERNFRWNTVEGAYRGKTGIGWNVPHKVHAHSRPGIALLMRSGNTFEAENVQSFIDEFGEAAILTAGIEGTKPHRHVRDLPFSAFVERSGEQPFPQFVAQLEVILDADEEARLLRYFDLDPAQVKLGPARPDWTLDRTLTPRVY